MNAMVFMILRLEKELEMQREGRALPIRDDFEVIRPMPQRKKRDHKEAAGLMRQSGACDHSGSID